ncbi:hypothetical protein IKQ26_09765 [bacterium]|nr:hypothetical protein [bacterium]
MLKRLVLLLSVLLICPLCFAGQPVNATISPVQNNNVYPKYPQELLINYNKEYLDYYFSLPEESRTNDDLNRFGLYDSKSISCFNSQYKPTSTIYPLVPEWQLKQAEYYFNEGLKMEERERKARFQ